MRKNKLLKLEYSLQEVQPKNEEPQVTLFSNLNSQKLWLLVARVKKKGERDRDANKSKNASSKNAGIFCNQHLLPSTASFVQSSNLLMALPEVVSLDGSS